MVRIPELKVRALLADLLIHEGRPVHADRLIEDLWGETAPGNPGHALQTKVSQLRRALESAEPGGRELVAHQAGGYLLRLEPEALDVQRFRTFLARARTAEQGPARSALLADALAVWRGPALADFADDEFARPVAARLEEERLTAMEDQAEIRFDLGEHSLLSATLGDLVAEHPLRERLRAAHMRALYRSGRQAEALDSYLQFRHLLTTELGVDPSPELTAVHQAILEQDPGLNSPPSEAVRPQTNLAIPLARLIGRDEEVAQVRSLLSANRLVTLTGPGGVGKTRLALEAAAGLTADFPDGVWLFELAGQHRPGGPGAGATPVDPADIVDVVTATLGIGGEPSPDPAARLGDSLRTRRMLLLLDNCEHIIEAAATVTGKLLPIAPAVHVLATSQEPLGLPGEILVTVPPLETPALSQDADPAALQALSAVQMFVQRARAATPEFTLNTHNAPFVAAICRRLDGIPLALELAATRVRTLGVRELAGRLDDRFRLLTTGHRGAPARQRTLRAMIDWTWELLDRPERTVLRRLAVHADGCDLEAAEEVCSGGDVSRDDVVDLLGRLVDRSLVTAAEDTSGLRYRLLESVAAFGLESLRDAGELDELREKHLEYYTTLAERAVPHLRGHDQRQWLRRLDTESANLRAALGEALLRRDRGALRLVNALAWYWFLRARYNEARRSLDSALNRLGGDARATAWRTGMAVAEGEVADWTAENNHALAAFDDPLERAHAGWFLALNLAGDGDTLRKKAQVDRALETFRSYGDQWGIAAALSTQALYAVFHGDLAAAGRLGDESLRLFLHLGDAWGQLQASDSLAMLAEITGDYERATDLHQNGLRMAEDLDLWAEVSWRLAQLGRISLLNNDHERAAELHHRALQLAARHNYRALEMFAEIGLALGARRQRHFDRAIGHMTPWLDWLPPDDPMAALIHAELGFIAELRGDGAQAQSHHLNGYSVARTSGDPRATALALEGLAGASALLGSHDHAARLLGAASAARASVGAPLPPAERVDVDRITAATQSALGQDTFTTTFNIGTRITDPDRLTTEPAHP